MVNASITYPNSCSTAGSLSRNGNRNIPVEIVPLLLYNPISLLMFLHRGLEQVKRTDQILFTVGKQECLLQYVFRNTKYEPQQTDHLRHLLLWLSLYMRISCQFI